MQPHFRKITTFARRCSRTSERQKLALQEYYPTLGIPSDHPIQLDKIFNNQFPNMLEIGFGMGHSLLDMARAQPQKNFIGIEVHRPGLGSVLLAAVKEGLQNIRVIEGDATLLLPALFPDESVEEVWLLFPDPWPKNRQLKRRIIKNEFLLEVTRILKPGGFFHMATDEKSYAIYALNTLNQFRGLQSLSADRTFVPRPLERSITKFEARGERLGNEVFDLRYKKPHHIIQE